MRTAEHKPKTRSAATGFLGMLGNLLHGRGSSAPSFTAPLRARTATLVLLVTAATLLAAAPRALAAEEPPSIATGSNCEGASHTSIDCRVDIGYRESQALWAELHWRLEYSTSQGGPWAAVSGPAGTGTVTAAELKEYSPSGRHEGRLYFAINPGAASLSPEVPYYFLLTATNNAGSTSREVENCPCQTIPLRPTLPSSPTLHNLTAVSVHAGAEFAPNGSETHWRFQYAPAEPGGGVPAENSPAWVDAPGAAGTVSQSEAEQMLENHEHSSGSSSASAEALLTGLSPSTAYWARLFAESEPAPGLHKHAVSPPDPFETQGPPVVGVFATHALHGEDMRALGFVQPNSTPSSEEQTIAIGGGATGGTFKLGFKGQRTGATGSGDLASGAATGSGDLSFAESQCVGPCHITAGSPTVTNLTTNVGTFAIGQEVKIAWYSSTETLSLFPAGTTIVAVGPSTITLSSPALATPPEVGGLRQVQAFSKTVTNLSTSTGTFAAGQRIEGAGIAPGTTIVAVGPTTLTLSEPPTAPGTAVALTADDTVITNLHTASGAFVTGEAISGPGIAAGTTIAKVGTNGAGTTLTLSQPPTAPGTAVALAADLPFDAAPGDVANALGSLSTVPPGSNLGVHGPLHGGPYSVYFGNGVLAGADQPQIEADSSGLTPSGSVTVTTAQQGGEGYDAHYHAEYISEEEFKADAESFGAGTRSTPEVGLGVGATIEGHSRPEFVGADLPGLAPGETYRYRLTATNTTPGDPVVHSAAQSLTVPSVPKVGPEEPCPNAAFRVGPSAALSDCRAYEQVTPHNKEGALDPFHYLTQLENEGTVVGSDGDHLELNNLFVHYAGAGTPFFFSRLPGAGEGWQMTSGAPQPATGVAHYSPRIFNPELTRFGFEARSQEEGNPPYEFKLGAPGGPYSLAATVPYAQLYDQAYGRSEAGWVAASPDLSTLILQVADHELLGPLTGTLSGTDLYEYSGGQLRQGNVDTAGATIGACGALVAAGREGNHPPGGQQVSSPHTVSADGRRFFFEAVPTGQSCSQPTHLYMRLDGGLPDAETVDLGAYRFGAADAHGTEVLLEQPSGAGRGFYLYDTATRTQRFLASTAPIVSAESQTYSVSEDLGTIFFDSRAHLTPEAPPTDGVRSYAYRYDVATETLRFVLPAQSAGEQEFFQSVPGLPAGGIAAAGEEQPIEGHAAQVLRYDSAENLVECLSCASPYDPEPTHQAFTDGGKLSGSRSETRNGVPRETIASANGDYVFFDTIAALIPSDIDGEIDTELGGTAEKPGGSSNASDNYSPSSDVYEWRRYGLHGCAHLQGCLSLISSGTGGHLVMLLGSTESGRDVFFSSTSQLGPNDNDTAIDIYDAREGGGESPAPPRPVECAGDACSTPSSPPNDVTPSSFTFSGAGNVLQPLPAKSTKPKPKRKRRHKARKHKRRTKTKSTSKAHKGGGR
jgi:hypothetical protein